MGVKLTLKGPAIAGGRQSGKTGKAGSIHQPGINCQQRGVWRKTVY